MRKPAQNKYKRVVMNGKVVGRALNVVLARHLIAARLGEHPQRRRTRLRLKLQTPSEFSFEIAGVQT